MGSLVIGIRTGEQVAGIVPVARVAPSVRSVPTDRTLTVVRSAPAVGDVPVVGRARPRLRITRRGRAVVRFGVVLLGVLVTAGVVLGVGRVARADPHATPLPVTYRVVQPGDTLWQIAGEVAPQGNRRVTIARILELNALQSESLAAGDRIAIPATG